MADILKSTRQFFKVIFRNRQSTIGFIIVTFFVLMATAGATFFPLNMTGDFANRDAMPSLNHLLGTDYWGRDVVEEIIHGSRDIIMLGVVAAIMAIVIGIIIGSLAGYCGGIVDILLNFVTNAFITLPAFPIMLILAVALNTQNIFTAAGILAIVSWGGVARVMRGQIMSLKYSEYVTASKIMGLSTFYIVFREIIPNTVSLLAVQFIGLFSGAVNASVGLMLLGAMAYSQTNWGAMITLALGATGIVYNPAALIYFISPIVCLGLLQLGCIFFASGVDEALNPRLRTE